VVGVKVTTLYSAVSPYRLWITLSGSRIGIRLFVGLTALLLVCGCRNPSTEGYQSPNARDVPSVSLEEAKNSPGAKWVGIGWHTLVVFGDDLAEPISRRLPETDDSFAAVFDFAVTPDGDIWYPLSRFDMTGNKLVRIDPLDPEEPPWVIDLGDDAPSPFNVLADDRWLYVLSKYSLTESELMRVLLSDTSVREKLTLPADGGGLGTVMAFANSEGPKLLGIRLFESFVIVDLQRLAVRDTLRDDQQIYGEPKYSLALKAWVIMKNRPMIIAATPSIQVRLVEFPLPDVRWRDQFGEFTSNSHFDLSVDGSRAVTLARGGDTVAVANLEHSTWESIHSLPTRIIGTVANLGDDRFAIGGNIVYDLKSDKLLIPKGTLITASTQIKPLPIAN